METSEACDVVFLDQLEAPVRRCDWVTKLYGMQSYRWKCHHDIELYIYIFYCGITKLVSKY